MLGAPAAMETLDRVLDLVVREADSDRATPARAGEGQTPARPFETNLYSEWLNLSAVVMLEL